MTETVVEVRDLAKSYDNKVRAVDGISFTVARGDVVALLGGNGAGKTTTIAMLLGLLIPTSGSVRIFGADMARNRYPALARLNFSSPYVDLPYRLTVKQNLLVYAGLYGVTDAKTRIAALAADLDIAGLIDREFGKLSSGQKTRVALAKALINRPELLLLDEPTASLDPDTADWVRGYLQGYCRESGASMLLASHNMAEVERLATVALIMKAGKIVDRGAPAELIARFGRQNMEEVFLDIARDRRVAAAS